MTPAETENKRFEFGGNWKDFLKRLNNARIQEAEESLAQKTGFPALRGKTFLDVGCGSGLFSLAAVRLGAERVHSFDSDPLSVACARELKRCYFPQADHWSIEEGDVLDPSYLAGLGQFDIVYAWGVLHHTGNMQQAVSNVSGLVSRGGRVWLAIYNDQGRASRYWATVKRTYNRLPAAFRFLLLGPIFIRLWGPTLLRDLVRGRPLRTWRAYGHDRGMSLWEDVVDWVGGYPFEVAKPEVVFDLCKDQGFILWKLRTCAGGHGNNEFVFIRCVE